MFKPRRFGGQNGPRNFGHGQNHNIQRRARFAPKALDPRLFVKPAVEADDIEDMVVSQFADHSLDSKILERLTHLGLEKPTPIQDKTLPLTIKGGDLIGLADTGTGKTMAFALPIVQKLLQNPNHRALILAPTRELAVQIRDEFRKVSEGMGIWTVLLIGGSNIQRQIFDLRKTHHIIIGTPGRVADLHTRRVLRFDDVKTVVLDEVDRMLDMGFVKEITKLLSFVPRERQTLLFSATIDDRVENIAREFMTNPMKISVKTGATSQNVEQNVIKTSGNKIGVLKDLLRSEHVSKALVFGRTKWGVEKLAETLKKDGFAVDAIHGDKRQSQREQALRLFKNNDIKVMIATDVAARGIDVKDITHVINYDQPATYEDYVHRIGRTGRAGKKGFAITFLE